MSSLSQSKAPIFKYNSLLIGDALRVVAKKNKRPDYSVIVCRELCTAIKNGAPHRLKSEVLGVLHYSCDTIPDYVDRPPKKGRTVNDYKGAYTKEMDDKIAAIVDWCSKGHGRYSQIATAMDMNFYHLKRRIDYRIRFKEADINRAHEIVTERIEYEVGGVNPELGTRENEEFFMWLINLYIRGMLDLAYKNIVTHKATSYKTYYDSIETALVPVGGRNAKYRYYALTEMIERMESKGLIQVQVPTKRGVGKSFRLTHTKHCKAIYKLAFSSIKPFIKADVMVQGKFSKSDAAQQLISNLEKVAFHAYSITPKP